MKINKFLLTIACFCTFSILTCSHVSALENENYEETLITENQTEESDKSIMDDTLKTEEAIISESIPEVYSTDDTQSASVNETGWVQDDEGYWYYYYSENYYATGYNTIDNHLYYFDEDGKMLVSSWKENNWGEWSYFGEDGAAYVGIRYVGDTQYYFYEDGCLPRWSGNGQSGDLLFSWNDDGIVQECVKIIPNEWVQFDDRYFLFDENLDPYQGVTNINGTEYFFYGDGSLPVSDGVITENNQLIAWDENGIVIDQADIVANQWIEFNGKWYYFDENLDPYEGIHNIDGTDYYFDWDGSLYTWAGTTTSNNQLIAWNENGVVTEKADVVANQWIEFNGEWYYFDENLDPYEGIHSIDGTDYYFNWDGSLYSWAGRTTYDNQMIAWNNKGIVTEKADIVANQWIRFDGEWYYFDENLDPYEGLHNIDGTEYYFTWDGSLPEYSGTATINNQLIAWDSNGIVIDKANIVANQWIEFDGGWYYFDENLEPYQGVHNIDGTEYYFNWNGLLPNYSGTAKKDNQLIAFNSKGVVTEKDTIVANQWIEFSGKWYYFDENLDPYEGLHNIDGVNYYFTWDGSLYTWGSATRNGNQLISWNDNGVVIELVDVVANQWISFNDNWYYFDEYLDGLNGLHEIDQQQYYFEEGIMHTGIMYIDDHLYAFATNGTMIKNSWYQVLYQISKPWYYFDENGRGVNGWQFNNQYYFKNGRMITGKQIIDNYLCVFGYNGIFQGKTSLTSGWLNISNVWYYYDGTKLICDQWITDNGNSYYMDYDGSMVTAALVSQHDSDSFSCYVVDASGKWVFNQWVKNEYGYYFYADENGLAANEWKKIGNTWYYFDYGRMINENKMIDNQINLFSSSGAWLGVSQTKNGWVKAESEWYYLINSKFATGWQKIGNNWYYFSEDTYCAYRNGGHYIDNVFYVFDRSCALSKGGWMLTDYGVYNYATADGIAVNEWQYINGQWYYFSYRETVSGMNYIDGKYYVFTDSGAWINTTVDTTDGWHKYGNHWYYMSDGYVVRNHWIQSGNDYYYVDYSGKMVTDVVISATDYYEEDNQPLGHPTLVYAFDENGVLRRNQYVTVNGKKYWADSEGVFEF